MDLKKQTNGSEKIVIIPEGVTKIRRENFSDLDTVVFPHSLVYFDNDCFSSRADEDGDYQNCTIVFFGVRIDLKALYYAYRVEFDEEEYFGDSYDPNDEDYEEYYDNKDYRDAKIQHYNEIAENVVDSILNELSEFLDRAFDVLEHQYFYDEEEEDQYDKSAPDAEDARLAMEDVYRIIVGMLRAFPDDEEILDYVREHKSKFLPYLSEDGDAELVQKL